MNTSLKSRRGLRELCYEHSYVRKKDYMPEQRTTERARKDAREGKSASTQAGEFVREEFRHIREGKHGARSPQQAIAIGLSKARRAGVKLPPSPRGKVSERAHQQEERDYERGRQAKTRVSPLKREGRQAASSRAISLQAQAAARRRSASARSGAARQAVRAKGNAKRSARKAARTRTGG